MTNEGGRKTHGGNESTVSYYVLTRQKGDVIAERALGKVVVYLLVLVVELGGGELDLIVGVDKGPGGGEGPGNGGLTLGRDSRDEGQGSKGQEGSHFDV